MVGQRQYRERWRGPVVAVLFLAVGLAFCGMQNRRLTAQRAVLLGQAGAGLTTDMPPGVVLTTVLLGGFRGMLADVLWFRAGRLQSEGRYVELVQLADWITRLEPQSSAIWAYHAWNMAYNVSAMLSEPAERWRWVQNGLALLRDDALRYTGDDPRLCFEIGLLFQYKMGTPLDRAHAYYQWRWAAAMQELFQGPGPTLARLAQPEFRDALRSAYGMEAALVSQVDGRYGPLDWRLPETHAIYWAHLGRSRAPDQRHFPCERMIYQSLVTTFFLGRLDRVGDGADALQRSPRLDLWPVVLAAYDGARATKDGALVRPSYERFLNDALPVLEASGRLAAADEARRRLAALANPADNG